MNGLDNMLSAFGDAIAERVIERIMPLISERQRPPEQIIISSDDNEVRGNKGLAAKLKVSVGTVQRWKNDGLLEKAVICEYGRVIIYDLNKAKDCIKYMPLKAGRPKKR